jgi:hypothetical protein
MTRLAAVLGITAVAACSGENNVFDVPQYSTAVRPVDVVIVPGEEIVVDGLLRVTFLEVAEDSRCPIDALCVWQGNGAVVIGLRMGMGPTRSFTLNTSVAPRAVTHGGYTIGLLELTPAPVSTARIDPRHYRARLHFERTP